MHATHNDLSISIREQVIAMLQAHLADSVDLFTQVKQARWNVKGPHFLALHELFCNIAGIIERHSDTMAERIAALGGRADGTVRVVARQSTVIDFPVDTDEGMVYVAVIAERLSLFTKKLRASIARASKCGDGTTAQLFTEICRDTDKQLWFLDAHLQAER